MTASRVAAPERPSVELLMLPVGSLFPGDDFRIDDDVDDLAELAASIAEYGVLQPLLVRQARSGWEVVAGRRRLAASRTAGLEHVPCVVRSLTDDEAADAALTENLHRRDLSPIEVALAMARLRDKGLTQKAIAARIGRSDFYVSVLLQLLQMPKRVQNKVHAGKMSYRTAYDQWKRDRVASGARQGTPPRTRGTADEASFAAVSHWRRRHDRLLAGIHAVLKARPREVAEMRMMLDRLLKLDLTVLEEEPSR